MQAMNISEARKNLPHLISEISASRNEVLITRHGKPVAKIVAYEPDLTKQNRYSLRGLEFQVEGDFDEPLPEMWDALKL
ncbi:MAG: type II toxin-antitoxin system Phd/YefM family antitoxin [Desulfonatronovibrio sp.]